MIGVDIVLISRISEAVKSTAFVSRVFTPDEQEYCNGKANPAASYAGIYAAKEAFGKATGRGINRAFHEVEVGHRESGQPFYLISGESAALIENKSARLSISHDGDYAIAFCVLEENK